MKTNEIIQKIEEWNPYCTHVTLTTIFSKLHLGRFHIINYGGPGSGKSRSTIDLLKQLNLGSDIFIDNNTTKKGLFELLMDFPQQDIVLDECSELLRDKGTQDCIKLSMESKPVSWIKNKSRQETVPFKGTFIINTNEQVLPSVVDRCFFNKTFMNKEMIMNYIDYAEKKHDFTEFLNFIKQKIKSKELVQLTDNERKKIHNLIKQYIDTESDEGLEYSRRCLERIELYFLCAKKLFGSLDKEVMEFITPYAKLYIVNEKVPSLIEAIVANGEIDKSELVQKVAQEGGYSERQARRLVNRYIENNTLKLNGRKVVLAKVKLDKTDTDKTDN